MIKVELQWRVRHVPNKGIQFTNYKITGARYLVVGETDAFEIAVRYIDYNGITFHHAKKPLFVPCFSDC